MLHPALFTSLEPAHKRIQPRPIFPQQPAGIGIVRTEVGWLWQSLPWAVEASAALYFHLKCRGLRQSMDLVARAVHVPVAVQRGIDVWLHCTSDRAVCKGHDLKS